MSEKADTDMSAGPNSKTPENSEVAEDKEIDYKNEKDITDFDQKHDDDHQVYSVNPNIMTVNDEKIPNKNNLNLTPLEVPENKNPSLQFMAQNLLEDCSELQKSTFSPIPINSPTNDEENHLPVALNQEDSNNDSNFQSVAFTPDGNNNDLSTKSMTDFSKLDEIPQDSKVTSKTMPQTPGEAINSFTKNDLHAKFLPSAQSPDLLNAEGEHETDEENINDLVETLASCRRHEPSPPGSPSPEEAISFILDTLPSSRRHDMTPELQASDNEDNHEMEIPDSYPSLKRHDPTPSTQTPKPSPTTISSDPIFPTTTNKVYESNLTSPKPGPKKRQIKQNENDDNDLDEESIRRSQYLIKVFKKRGKLPSPRERAMVLKETQRQRAEAMANGDYDTAADMIQLTRNLNRAIKEDEENLLIKEKENEYTEKLERAKNDLFTCQRDSKNIIEMEERFCKERTEEVHQNHAKELEKFEAQWNDENFLRKYSKPSSQLLQLKSVERSMALAKMFEEAKEARRRAEALEAEETARAQARAEREMAVQRRAMLARHEKEDGQTADSIKKHMEMVRKNRDAVELPYKMRVSALEAKISADADSQRIVTSRSVSVVVKHSRTSVAPLPSVKTTQRLLTACRKTNIPKLAIKPLGAVASTGRRKMTALPKTSSK